MNERRFVDTVRDSLLSSGIDLDRPLVAAVSGGADSMALLEALRQLSQEAIVEVIAAHFNHGLRGAESDLDERYVADWCTAWNIQCVTGHAGAGEIESGGRSPEAGARSARYAFLSRVQADTGASAVATGHTMDDQAETVLLHLVRGSGLAGLRGMGPLTQLRTGPALPPVTVVRPLLSLRRSDTEAFCAARDILPRYDTSNDDLTIPRNRLRRQVVPVLQSISPGAVGAIARFAAAAHDDLDFLSAATDAAWAAVSQRGPSADIVGAHVSRAKFRGFHPAIRRRVLMRMCVQAAGDHGDREGLALDHVEAMLALAEGRPGTSLDLPGGLRFQVGYRNLTITPADAPSDPSCPFPHRVPRTDLPVPAAIDLGEGFVVRTETVGGRKAGRVSRWTAYLDRSLAGTLAVRSRERGDRFMPSGMTAVKKLQDFFVDAKVPRTWRDRVPLIVSDRGIAWVVGFRVAEWAGAKGRGTALRLTAAPIRRPGSENPD